MEDQPAAPLLGESRETPGTNFQDEDEDVCRICRSEAAEGDPLFFPCACSGSIKYVHQSCLLQWLRHSSKTHCEVTDDSELHLDIID